jgi:small ligand-binding sensory domain FIST
VCVALAGQRPSILAKGAGFGPSAGLLTLDDVSVICCVAQGARSIGPVRAITRVKDNLIVELDGRPAIEALMRDLPPSLQNQLPRLAGSLFVGFAASDDTPLMRAVVGLDPHTGGVAVTDLPREGSGVTFALRDPRSARIDTEEAVESLAMALHGPDPPLLLTVHNSVARDKNLFEAPLWDINRVRAHLPSVPVVGGSGAGEICTWGSGTFLFGMSAVVAALVPSH